MLTTTYVVPHGISYVVNTCHLVRGFGQPAILVSD